MTNEQVESEAIAYELAAKLGLPFHGPAHEASSWLRGEARALKRPVTACAHLNGTTAPGSEPSAYTRAGWIVRSLWLQTAAACADCCEVILRPGGEVYCDRCGDVPTPPPRLHLVVDERTLVVARLCSRCLAREIVQ